ncbi:hypothetical protein GWK36_11090 [Caldichromatium japonicum]|uniref:Uncharacterized protein n=1 Tax=Caldichromatium japonicum TaxID=2699430 RepID=A0A6G7VEQ4_9GAMM|nr:hypothetical protein [Caldichromatium japonicum]QIK38432.1 hypothetical protein GWK36_11090 [Caldichromatium japonicum]
MTKILPSMLLATGVATGSLLIPTEMATAYYWWGDGPLAGPWRHAYIYDPNYRWGPPQMRNYIRDLYLYGPSYAQWRQARRWGWW